MKARTHNKKQYTVLRKDLRNDATKAERTLWTYIRNNQMGGYKFRRQHSIDSYIVDFYCPELQLIIEIDGWVHGEDDQREKDIRRQGHLEKKGFLVIRYTNAQVRYELRALLQDLWNTCTDRARAINHP